MGQWIRNRSRYSSCKSDKVLSIELSTLTGKQLGRCGKNVGFTENDIIIIMPPQ
jgi:hypothetical protein